MYQKEIFTFGWLVAYPTLALLPVVVPPPPQAVARSAVMAMTADAPRPLRNVFTFSHLPVLAEPKRPANRRYLSDPNPPASLGCDHLLWVRSTRGPPARWP